ncbi:IS1595 family transposase [Paenibacillus alba]|uniref:transposase n=1 Tax=Paenibacillus alba TaxID=1197127 RepID=UPI0015660420|nr:transposase [Paenibacillus alba]NQX68905.1 IS1595 family transposase [Paenibacillus alba]
MDFSSMSLEQFHVHFPTESACVDYLFNKRWPAGFQCPRCSHPQAYVTTTRRLPLYECCHCRFQISLISGTIMEGSRTELRKWLTALFLVSRTDKGTSAVELSHIIQVTYKTAWLILHKIRSAIHNSDILTPLAGAICVNSAVYGRPYNPTVNKHPKEHLLLIASSHNDANEFTSLKIKHIISTNPKVKHISRSDIITFQNEQIDIAAYPIDIVTGFYTPKRLRPLLKFTKQASQWINDTFHGIGAKHLQIYLDDFCFRFNLSFRNLPLFPCLIERCFRLS